MAAGWLSEALSTITSNVFTELTVSIALVSLASYNMAGNELRAWNSVDNALNRFNLCDGVTLVVKTQDWVGEDQIIRGLVRNYFPSMWDTGRVVFEVLPPDGNYVIPRRRQCRR